MSNTNQTNQANSKEELEPIEVEVEDKKIEELEVDELETQSTKSVILDFLNNEQTQKTLRSLNFWLKFSAIVMWIVSAPLLIVGLIGIIYIFGPLIYWPIAGINIWLGIILWQVSEQIKLLSNSSNQDEFNIQIIVGLTKIKQYFQINGWLTIVGLLLIALFFIFLLLVMFYSLNNSGGFKMEDMQRFNYISSFYV